jgi:flagellar motility protein MotE (MotC chaperone)
MMKFKIITILATVTFVSGLYLSENLGPAYAEVKQINEETGKVRAETETLPLEDQEAKEKEKVRLPGQTPAISPETFRMIEIIENKNREIKKKEEELRLKEVRLEALEAKILKDLKKIEKSISESKEQMGAQDAKTKANVNSLIKVYSSMKPEEAASLVEAIDEELALSIVSGMKSKIAGQVLSKLDVKVAKRISEKLAGKKQKPAIDQPSEKKEKPATETKGN